jgi:hypothetical protein
MRSLDNKDMSTGKFPLFDTYKTPGPSNTWHIKNIPPPKPDPVCYILSPETCTNEQFETVMNGSAIIKNFIVIGVNKSATELPYSHDEQKNLLDL